MRIEAKEWWEEALAELDIAEANFRINKFSACSFYCHQTIEKALKALYLQKAKALPPKSHNIVELGKLVRAPAHIINSCIFVNPEYTITRYPDAVAGIPSKIHTREFSSLHLREARKVIAWVRKKLRL